jgi:hypothetical protein
MTRKEILRLMPANAEDIEGAIRIVELGYPIIAPVFSDMVSCMRVAESPVADTFADFFGRLGSPALEAIGAGLGKENCWLRHRIFTRVLPLWPSDSVAALANILTMIAAQPDAYDNDLRCIVLLAKNHLADKHSFSDWVVFKKERMAERNKWIQQVEAELNRS